MPKDGSKEMGSAAGAHEDDDVIQREAYQNLNPASTTSSLQRIDRASHEEPIEGGANTEQPSLEKMNQSYHIASDEIKIR